MLCALIMAGGKGERFWPLSTDKKPKQFLNLLGEDSMIQMTVKRLNNLIPIERIFVVTAKIYVDLVKKQLPLLPDRNIIIEPIGKNTAPCISLSALIIDKYYKDATIAVLPSDHLVKNEENFRNTIENAYKFICLKEKAIVTLGMTPDRPETGYGYIKSSKAVCTIDNSDVRIVEKFVEKPDEYTAIQYLEEGNFLWNSGMFVWKTSTILECTKNYLGRTFYILSEIAATDDRDFEEALEEKYRLVDSISVDYGIMEKADNIYVIPCDFGWDDLGTWNSVERYRNKDKFSNVKVGEIKIFDSSNNIIVSSTKPITVAGIDNLFIVEGDDMIFISNKDQLSNIKQFKV